MAYESYPNAGHNNRAVTQDEYERMAVPLGLSGLLDYTGTMPILADSSGRQVKLRSGVAASVRGSRFTNLSETVIALGANGTANPRIDMVVLRLNRSNWEITPTVIAGVAGASPIAPAIVRNTLSGGSGFWDLPLAEVRVAAGATTIAAGDVTHRACWIGGSGYVSSTDGRPAPEPGVIWYDANTSIHWIGTSSGTYVRLASSTGLVTLAPPSGWSGTLHFRRDTSTVHMGATVKRTGAALGNSVSPTLATLAAAYRPPVDWPGVYHCSYPDHSSDLLIRASDGAVVFNGTSNGDGIDSQATLFASVSWPAASA